MPADWDIWTLQNLLSAQLALLWTQQAVPLWERDERIAKFWLKPARLQDSGGISRVEIRRVEAIVIENLEALLRSWDEFFSS